MDIATGIAVTLGWGSKVIPPLRWLWIKCLERNMEVMIRDPIDVDKPPEYFVNVGPIRTIEALVTLELINHRPDRIERIRSCRVELRESRALLWHRTLASASVRHFLESTPVEDITIEKMSKRVIPNVKICGSLGGVVMPRRSWLVMIFDMIGPLRRYEKHLTDVRHFPQQ